jgi:hypothetical protein
MNQTSRCNVGGNRWTWSENEQEEVVVEEEVVVDHSNADASAAFAMTKSGLIIKMSGWFAIFSRSGAVSFLDAFQEIAWGISES